MYTRFLTNSKWTRCLDEAEDGLSILASSGAEDQISSKDILKSGMTPYDYYETLKTPIKTRKTVPVRNTVECEYDGDHRYIVQSIPNPRISGVKNSVSKYHPDQKVSLRMTPFQKRIDDEIIREESVLKDIHRKASSYP